MSDPGLDPRRLQALRPPGRNLSLLVDRIADHLAEHDGYVAFSTGKDSLAALHLALQADPAVPVVFFDSGFEYPETYAYLEQITTHLRCPVQVIPARVTTLQMLRQSGDWDHTAPTPEVLPRMFDVLIAEPAARAHARHGRGEVWGVRAAESRGRAAAYANALAEETERACPGCCRTRHQQRLHHGGVIRRADGTVAFGPVWNWKDRDVWSYLAHHELPEHPVYGKLRALGAPPDALRVSHMFDAHRISDGRLTWLRRGWPDLFDELATVLPRIREYV